jgi:hypothetical protein
VQGSYLSFTDVIQATSDSTTLTFTGVINAPDGPFYLADVDVEPVSAPIPEPSAMLLLASTLALFSMVRFRQAWTSTILRAIQPSARAWSRRCA